MKIGNILRKLLWQAMEEENEQELIKNSTKPWKDKLDVDADGLY